MQLASIARACELTAAQQQKLELAGKYDVQRLKHELDELKARFGAGRQDQQTYSELINAGSTMQTRLQTGIYDESSFYHKVLGQTLTPDQSARLERQERERRKFNYTAKIELVMSSLQSNLACTAEQRQRLVKLVVDNSEPPKKNLGQYYSYVVIYQLGKLDETKVKAILDDSQWKSFKAITDQYRGMEQFLKQQGYVP